jgi:hypothetical protein
MDIFGWSPGRPYSAGFTVHVHADINMDIPGINNEQT